MIINWKLKQAFQRVKYDIHKLRYTLTNGLFSLSAEYAKLQLRIQNLERSVERLEGHHNYVTEEYNLAESY
jgi:cell division protein FtsB